MEKIKLEVLGISYSQSHSGSYALILGESGGRRRLPIIIGGYEAQAIAIEIENMKPARPLTHDLFKNFAEEFGIRIVEVIINKFHEGVFYARLVCFDGEREKDIDSRTSDAVALALRYQCPIYTYEKILKETGVIIDEEHQQAVKPKKKEKPEEELLSDDITPSEDLSELPLEELETLLKQAIEDEAFERASQIRDEIKRRK